MATLYPDIASRVAHMPEIHVAVLEKRDKVARFADIDFSSHDRPGGHEITTQDEEVDALVSLDGPAPLSVEYGHWTRPAEGHPRRYVEGLHILGRAEAAAETL